MDLDQYVNSDDVLASVRQPQAEPEAESEPVDESERPALLAKAIEHLRQTPTATLKAYIPPLGEFADLLKAEADDDTPEAENNPPTPAPTEGGAS